MKNHIKEVISDYAEDLQSAKAEIKRLKTENKSLKQNLNIYECVSCGAERKYVYYRGTRTCNKCKIPICKSCANYAMYAGRGYCKKCIDTPHCLHCGKCDVQLVAHHYNTIPPTKNLYCVDCNNKLDEN